MRAIFIAWISSLLALFLILVLQDDGRSRISVQNEQRAIRAYEFQECERRQRQNHKNADWHLGLSDGTTAENDVKKACAQIGGSTDD